MVGEWDTQNRAYGGKEISMDAGESVGWLKKNKEIVILMVGVILFLLMVGIGLRWQRGVTGGKTSPEVIRESVKIKIDIEPDQSAEQEAQKLAQTSAFFLKPSPAEILTEIEKIGSAELSAPAKQYSGLRVLWPAYFFHVSKKILGSATVLLDVSEDGFGAAIMTDIDTSRFPQILEIERGKMIWVAGEIQAVDPTGTGTIYMRTEYVSFQDDMPQSPPLPETE